MASLKLYLDARKAKTDDECPITFILSHKNSTYHIGTGLRVRKDQFFEGTVINHPQKRTYNRVLEEQETRYRMELIRLDSSIGLRLMTGKQVRDALLGKTDAPEPVMLESYWETYLRRIGKRSTYNIYAETISSLRKFTDVRHLTLEDVDVAFLKEYRLYLQKRCRQNTIAMHERNIRAVINSAITDGLLSQDRYPFRRYKVMPIQTTIKRSLTVEQLRAFISTPCDDVQRPYRDFFVLSFLLAGINVVDLLSLPKQERYDRVCYRRSKTGVYTECVISERAREIILRYEGEERMLRFGEGRTGVNSFTDALNTNLRKVGPVTWEPARCRIRSYMAKTFHPLFPDITSYWARHTWASIASELDIPDATIDLALAHRSNFPMSEVYIKRNYQKVSDAVLQVERHVFDGM